MASRSLSAGSVQTISAISPCEPLLACEITNPAFGNGHFAPGHALEYRHTLLEQFITLNIEPDRARQSMLRNEYGLLIRSSS